MRQTTQIGESTQQDSFTKSSNATKRTFAKIAFLDLEVSTQTRKIQNIGILLDEFECEQVHLQNLKELFTSQKPDFICGHNFIEFDKAYLSNSSFNVFVQSVPIIDTLYLSLLLFPDKATHRLEKPYKHDIHRESPANSPLQDCKNTKNLFIYLNECFENLPQNLQDIFTLLLKDNAHFKGYFSYRALLGAKVQNQSLSHLIKEEFGVEDFARFVGSEEARLDFAFALSFINMLKIKEARYFSTYILARHWGCVEIVKSLRSTEHIELEAFGKDEFGIDGFRSFKRAQSQSLLEVFAKDSKEISQKDIIQSALEGESFLAILPTGGGKTLTFQLPALIKAKQCKSLTVVISPLQALMQNHIQSFKAKNQNFCIEAISGFLNPIERFGVFDKLTNGEVDILYLAPEALRSQSIFKALQKRHIERFVIDEAHCFSMWGHNFRQDYHFIAQSIKDLESSPHQDKIAISCFSATAKPEVIEDIKQYFRQNLDIDLKTFIASSERKSLSYEVLQVENEEQKKERLWQILLQREQEKPLEMKNPTIIYIPQNAGFCKRLCEWLTREVEKSGLDFVIEPFYARLDDDVSEGKKQGRKKAQILQDFMDNEVDIIIATTAFGMGIDKPDITTIIHYELSDSLESYIQESGRGARDEERYKAKCFILYDKKDIDKNFYKLRQSNLDFGEIKSLVRVLKNEYKERKRNTITVSLKTLHKRLGKYEEEFDAARIKTSLLEIEKAGIIKRARVKTQIYATSFRLKVGKDKMGAVHKILDPQKHSLLAKSKEKRSFDDALFLELYDAMILIVQNIIQRSRENSAISLDELDEIVGSIGETQMVQALKILEKNALLGKENDILLFIDSQKAREKTKKFFDFERGFFEAIKEYIKRGQAIDLREFNNEALKNLAASSVSQNPLYVLRFIIKSWGYLLRLAQVPFKCYFKNEQCFFALTSEVDKLDRAISSRQGIARFVIDTIAQKLAQEHKDTKPKEIYVASAKIYDSLQEKGLKSSLSGFHSTLNMMSAVLDRDFDIRAGRLIYHQKECIECDPERLSEKVPYRKEHYNASFKIFMEQKIANIHILQAFLDSFVRNGENSAKAFMRDYFSLSKRDFIRAHKIDEKFIKSPISKELLNAIILDLNDSQRKILEDTSSAIMIFAGPGSGKTKTLVHKMAHLLTKEDKKSENFLMLAHSRIAVLEFRARLYSLLGEQALGVKILTFHSFALSLLGERVENDEELDNKITQATRGLKEATISLPYIEMLVLDEYQDVNAESYEFIKAIYAKMRGEKQIIAVGDDDQLIGEFLGADKRFIKHFKQDFGTQDEDSEIYEGGEVGDEGGENIGGGGNASDDEGESGGNEGEQESKRFSTHTLSVNYRSGGKILDFINAFRKAFLPDSLKSQNLIPSDKNKHSGFVSLTLYMHNLSLQEIAKQIRQIQASTGSAPSNESAPSIALLLRSNDEVLRAQYALAKAGINAGYILDKEGFEVGDLVELWEFLECLKSGLDTRQAYKKICEVYQNSQNLELFKRALKLFAREYRADLDYARSADKNLGASVVASDFEKFLAELKFEEIEEAKGKVIISTIHKAKGKEFDIVFVGVKKDFRFSEIAERRLLYVAFSRAKQKLFIHTQREDLECLCEHFGERKTYEAKEAIPQKIRYEMGLKDIFLSYEVAQNNLKDLRIMAGEMCEVRDREDIELLYKCKGVENKYVDGKCTEDKYAEEKSVQKCVGRLSKKLAQTLRDKIAQGYELEKQARVKYVVKWRDKQKGKMTTQVLCEVLLHKG